MDFDHDKRVKYLCDKAAGYIGMIAEVRSKCLLLKSRLGKASSENEDTYQLEEEAMASVEQMKKDLAKYSRRLDKIYEELRGYGIISDME